MQLPVDVGYSNRMPDPTRPEPPGISRTSIFVAAGRALGAREPDPSARNPDYLAEKLLGDPSTLGLDHPAVRALSLSYDEALKDPEVASNVRMMIVRAFIDEALERAIAGGATQVVILARASIRMRIGAWTCWLMPGYSRSIAMPRKQSKSRA